MQWRWNHSGESGSGLTTFWSEQQVRVVINECIILWIHGVSVELFLELLLMLLVLVSHDVQNGISYDVDFVRWPLHFEFPSYTSVMLIIIVHGPRPHPPHTLSGRPLLTSGMQC